MNKLTPFNLLMLSIIGSIILAACSEQPKESTPEKKAPINEVSRINYSAENFFATTAFFGSNINAKGDTVLIITVSLLTLGITHWLIKNTNYSLNMIGIYFM